MAAARNLKVATLVRPRDAQMSLQQRADGFRRNEVPSSHLLAAQAKAARSLGLHRLRVDGSWRAWGRAGLRAPRAPQGFSFLGYAESLFWAVSPC